MFGKLVTRSDPKSTLTALPGARLLAGASVLALIVAFIATTPQPASAFTCDSVTNPAGGNAGATDNGDSENTACGKAAEANGGKASAFGNQARALANGSVAVGRSSQVDSTAIEGIAIGRNAHVEDVGPDPVGAIAIGRNAIARGEFAVSVGESSKAYGSRSTAMGKLAEARGDFSTALGYNTLVSLGHTDSTAIGANAETTRANQVMLGTAAESYTLPGLPGDLSRSFQSGPLELVTTDAEGNLASGGGSIFGDIEDNTEGIAIALALENPDLKGSEKFGIAVNGGYYGGEYAVAGTVMATLFEGANGGRLAIAGGAGYGVERENVGARAGFQLTW